MTMVSARIVGEIVKGFITIELRPERSQPDSLNQSSGTLADNVKKELIPKELSSHGTEIWLATEKTNSVEKGYIQKVFPRTTKEYPQEYHDWLKEIGAK